jgi:hypothetical protein
MEKTSLNEYDDCYVLDAEAESVAEASRFMRLAMQGKLDGMTIQVNNTSDGRVTLRVDVPKAKNRNYDSMMHMGSRKIV